MYNSKIETGTILKSNSYGDFKVIEARGSRDVTVEFTLTGTRRVCRRSSVTDGSIVDPYFPKVAGVGFTGEGVYTHSKNKIDGKVSANRASRIWSGMLKRCYVPKNKNFSNYGGNGVYVASEWHNFQNFAEWYFEWDNGEFELDKDLLCLGNKEYSKEKCILVPRDVNVFFKSNGTNKKSGLPIGVMFPKDTDRKNPRPKGYLGTWEKSPRFFTAEECHFAYIEERLEKLKNLLEIHKNSVKDGRFLPAMLDRVGILEYHLDNKLIFHGWDRCLDSI